MSSRTKKQAKPLELINPTLAYLLSLTCVALCSFVTRFHTIELPPRVAWDETHFGKHANHYINGNFFFDIHPPLGKMLIALVGYMTGYQGTFSFKEPGLVYEDEFYIPIRIFCASLGTLIIPLVFETVWTLTASLHAALIASFLVIFDTGTLTLTQYILLDSPLLFFIMSAVLSVTKLHSLFSPTPSIRWYMWMAMTGFSIACAFGVKWVGAFTVVYVGIITIKELWDLLGDLNTSIMEIVAHFLIRVLLLIILPIVVYSGFFAVHFILLDKSGEGDGFFSSRFQTALIGNPLHDLNVAKYVAFGSNITLKNHRAGGGLLHSHYHLYPEEVGPQQQQMTTYTFKDDNNLFRIKPWDIEWPSDADPVIVKSGDVIRLEHLVTRRNLHSHRDLAPITKIHYQVSGYGENGTGDSNDVWIVEVVGEEVGSPVHALSSVIKLYHYNIKCALHSHNRQLPKWGWEQLEVTCNPSIFDAGNLWNVEYNFNDKIETIQAHTQQSSFISKLMETQWVMAENNNNLKPKEGEITSQPHQWPINSMGQHFSAGDHRVYLLGNPIVFWTNFSLIFYFLITWLLFLSARQRGIKMPANMLTLCDSYFPSGLILLLGWGLHYLPFYLMGRVLYFHHYFPALMFSCMLSAVILDLTFRLIATKLLSEHSTMLFRSFLTSGIIAVLGYSFCLFMPLSYGMGDLKSNEPGSLLHGLRWVDSWDI